MVIPESQYKYPHASVVVVVAAEQHLGREGDVGGLGFAEPLDPGVKHIGGGDGPAAVAGGREILVFDLGEIGYPFEVVPGELHGRLGAETNQQAECQNMSKIHLYVNVY